MSDKTIEPQFFRTIEDFVALPAEKITHCVRDFELWLRAIKIAESHARQITTPTDVFGWLDDGKHDVKVQINGLDVKSLRDQHQMEVEEVADAIFDRIAERMFGKHRKGGRNA
jgi:hypothetical protein